MKCLKLICFKQLFLLSIVILIIQFNHLCLVLKATALAAMPNVRCRNVSSTDVAAAIQSPISQLSLPPSVSKVASRISQVKFNCYSIFIKSSSLFFIVICKKIWALDFKTFFNKAQSSNTVRCKQSSHME